MQEEDGMDAIDELEEIIEEQSSKLMEKGVKDKKRIGLLKGEKKNFHSGEYYQKVDIEKKHEAKIDEEVKKQGEEIESKIKEGHLSNKRKHILGNNGSNKKVPFDSGTYFTEKAKLEELAKKDPHDAKNGSNDAVSPQHNDDKKEPQKKESEDIRLEDELKIEGYAKYLEHHMNDLKKKHEEAEPGKRFDSAVHFMNQHKEDVYRKLLEEEIQKELKQVEKERRKLLGPHGHQAGGKVEFDSGVYYKAISEATKRVDDELKMSKKI